MATDYADEFAFINQFLVSKSRYVCFILFKLEINNSIHSN